MNETNARKPKVFLTFSHEDEGIATEIISSLQRDSIASSAWQLSPGDSIQSRLLNLVSASDFVVVLLTQHSIQSQWVEEDLSLPLIRELNNRAITVLPVLLDDVPVPPVLRNRAYLDARGNPASAVPHLREQLARAWSIDFSLLDQYTFERLIEDVLIALGFAISEKRAFAGDLGFDFVATYPARDPFGNEEHESWLVEAKLYREQRLSVSALQQIFKSLSSRTSAYRALVITNGRLTSVAREFLAGASESTGRSLRVIDGSELNSILLQRPEIVQKYFVAGTGR